MPKRILVFCPVPQVGGVQSMAMDMARGIRCLGHDVTMAIFERSNRFTIEPRRRRYGEFPAVSLASFRMMYILLHTWNWGAKWYRFLGEFDAAVVVCGSPYIAAPFLRSPVPVYLWTAVTMKEDLKGRFERFTAHKKLAYRLALPFVYGQERRAVEQCAHCWALSSPTLHDLEKVVGRPLSNASVLLPPIDAKLFCPPTRPAKRPNIIFVGRYDDDRKNTALVIRALRHVRKVVPDATVTLIGAEYVPEGLRTLAHDLGLAHAVEFMASKKRDTLPGYYQSAQVFVLPSWQEGLCIAALEGMACGLPVVSTKCGGPESYVTEDETGYLVPLDNPEAMGHYLTRILSDASLRNFLSRNARGFVEAKCARADFAGKIGGILEKAPLEEIS